MKDIIPHTNEILEAFNFPQIPQLAPPIVRDYVKFNEQTDPDNVEAAGGFFDFRKTGSQLAKLWKRNWATDYYQTENYSLSL